MQNEVPKKEKSVKHSLKDKWTRKVLNSNFLALDIFILPDFCLFVLSVSENLVY